MFEQIRQRMNLWNNFKSETFKFKLPLDKVAKRGLQDLYTKCDNIQKEIDRKYTSVPFEVGVVEVLKLVDIQEMLINEIKEYRNDIISYQEKEIKEKEYKATHKRTRMTKQQRILASLN